ncbi:MAG: hypothetical protein AAF639_21080 [Chloroflexota bacterium]
MTVQTIELSLPKLLYERIMGIARYRKRDVQDLLVETIDREFAHTPDALNKRYAKKLQSAVQHSMEDTARARLSQLLDDAEELFDTILEERHSTELPNISSFLTQFEPLMDKIWQTAKDVSRPHGLIACQLFNIAQIYQAGHHQLQPEQLKPLEEVLMLLNRSQLNIEDAAKADRYLIAEGLQTIFQLHGDLDEVYTAKLHRVYADRFVYERCR